MDHSTDQVIGMLLDRFERGDHLGALAMADEVFDSASIPVLLVPREGLAACHLDSNETCLAERIDGSTPLPAVLDAADLPTLGGLRALSMLVHKGLVTFVDA